MAKPMEVDLASPYDELKHKPSTFTNPDIPIRSWRSEESKEFGGDIKIVEKKIDMDEEIREAELPEFLHDRYVSFFVRGLESNDNIASLGIVVVRDGLQHGLCELRTNRTLFPDIWEQVDKLWDVIIASGAVLSEIRCTFPCKQSYLESLIQKQVLAQEFNDNVDVTIICDPGFTALRFFTQAFSGDRKKFSKRVRSSFELTELASRVHCVGLKYRCRDSISSFERHEIAPTGFVHLEE